MQAQSLFLGNVGYEAQREESRGFRRPVPLGVRVDDGGARRSVAGGVSCLAHRSLSPSGAALCGALTPIILGDAWYYEKLQIQHDDGTRMSALR